MRQGRKSLALCAVLALAVAGWCLSIVTMAPPAAAASSEAKSGRARNAMHQFTGYVTALDQSTLTVEKRGKKPRTVVFAKHADMKTTGNVEKNARVTVYYRDEGGRSVAHRVVAKLERPRSPSKG